MRPDRGGRVRVVHRVADEHGLGPFDAQRRQVGREVTGFEAAADRVAETVDPGEGLSPGAGRKRPLWIGRGVADLLGTLARACGSKVQSVGIVAASLALAAEPVSSEKQRAQFAEVAARFLTSSRTKIAGLIGAAGALR